jgi:hypothetical protein
MAQSLNQVKSDNNILYFLNGAYNLDTNEFQKDVQETNKLSTGINYVEELDTEKVKFINDFINKVLPSDELKNKVMHLFASSLNGSKQPVINVWVGDGANGKSTLLNFYKNTIGDYSCSKASIDSRNYCIFTKEDKFKNQRLLTICEDTFICDSNQIANNKYNIIVECNELQTSFPDENVFKFTSKFCDNPDPSKPNEFLIEQNLIEKLNEVGMREVFMQMIIQHYQNKI